MEKASQNQKDAKQNKVRRPVQVAPDPAVLQGGQSLPPVNTPIEQYQPQQLMELQRRLGNQAVQRIMTGESGPNRIMRAVPYNAEMEGGRIKDPELAQGTLPFTDEGWDGRQIARNLSQLNPAAPRSDVIRCVQTAFLVELVQRGPGAVNAMIENYLNRYRAGLHQVSTPANIRRWYQRAIHNLSPIPAKINDKTATYDDLSTLQREMFDVYGGPGGTNLSVEINMMRREGYTAQSLNMVDVTQAQAAAQAATLKPGEFLSCGVNNTALGTGAVNHEVHIGAYPDTGALFLYDPAPVKGDQLIELDGSLSNISYYFVNTPEDIAAAEAAATISFENIEITGNPSEGETEGAEIEVPETASPRTQSAVTTGETPATPASGTPTTPAGEEAAANPTPRTFIIAAKYSPPAEAAEETGA